MVEWTITISKGSVFSSRKSCGTHKDSVAQVVPFAFGNNVVHKHTHWLLIVSKQLEGRGLNLHAPIYLQKENAQLATSRSQAFILDKHELLDAGSRELIMQLLSTSNTRQQNLSHSVWYENTFIPSQASQSGLPSPEYGQIYCLHNQ
ncbi:hypothetical protein QQP08_015296 [Theobroma cacao]|nr:hypothetical protein QQP08_015296 [Theobroma cacao]